MNTEQVKQLGEMIQNCVNELSDHLQSAKKEGIQVTFRIEKPASTTDAILEKIEIVSISQSIKHEFKNDKPKGDW